MFEIDGTVCDNSGIYRVVKNSETYNLEPNEIVKLSEIPMSRSLTMLMNIINGCCDVKGVRVESIHGDIRIVDLNDCEELYLLPEHSQCMGRYDVIVLSDMHYMTLTVVIDSKDEDEGLGIALCDPRDTFNLKDGVGLSSLRAMQDSFKIKEDVFLYKMYDR